MDALVLAHFRRTIADAAGDLLAYSDAEAARPRAPGKWSRKEIIGHLIDSAANNHARFVRGQLEEGLVFEDYDQAGWVEVQRYRERSWTDLVRLWQAYNLHLASVMEDAPATLNDLMRDYIVHLKHHLAQTLTPSTDER